MILNKFHNIFLILVIGFHCCHSKATIKLRIYNYQNANDIRHNGEKCEVFHWLNDHCDPMFHVCVTSRYNCDVKDQWVNHWKNKKYVYDVFSKSLNVDYLRSAILVDVKAVDHDRYDAHDYIASFKANFDLREQNHYYWKKMDVIPWGMNVHLYASIVMQCEANYFGAYCNTYCKPKVFNYACNRITGEKSCTLSCGEHGFCDWNNDSERFHCKCTGQWYGRTCRFITYSDCSKVRCKKRCIHNGSYKECTCSYRSYTEKCKETLTTPIRKLGASTTKSTKTSKCGSTFNFFTTTKKPKVAVSKFVIGSCSDHPACRKGKKVYCDYIATYKKICRKLCGVCGVTTPSSINTRSTFLKVTTGEKPTVSSKEDFHKSSIMTNAYTNFMAKTQTTLMSKESYSTVISLSFQHDAEQKRTPSNNKSYSQNSYKVKVLSKTKDSFSKKKHEVPESAIKESLQQNQASTQFIHYSPSTIVIISLLILLCVCILSLLIVIRRLKKKQVVNKSRFITSPNAQRPLPPVIYEPRNPSRIVLSSVFGNPRLPEIPQSEYDQCTIESEYPYATPLLKPKTVYNQIESDVYEEPIMNNVDSMTCTTDFEVSGDDDSMQYEVPTNRL